MKWNKLRFGTADLLADYQKEVVEPVRSLTRINIAGKTVGGIAKMIGNIVQRGSVADRIAMTLDKHLFKGATLKSIPAEPRFVINASNLQSGVLWRFMNPYMRDWRVGEIRNTSTMLLACAVGASAAFPPFLAPATFQFSPEDFTPNSGADLQRLPFTSGVYLGDGGIYDNLGLETAYKRYRTLFVSNAGAPFREQTTVSREWVTLSKRVIDVIDQQVGSLRKRLLIDTYRRSERFGAFWDIDQNIKSFSSSNHLDCPYKATQELAYLETDLVRKDDRTQERLINWGYAICDASIRTHFDVALPAPSNFPYSKTRV